MKKKCICLTIIISLIASLLSGCKADNKPITKNGFYFDTIISITLYDSSQEKYIDECFQLASKCEKLFSNTIADSDVYKINQAAGQKAVKVHSETLELIQKGITYGQISNGCFDITIGNLSDLWNISEISKNLQSNDNETDSSKIPASEDISSALSHVNYKNVIIKDDTVMLSDAKSKIDLGGIAKGYIADLMKEHLVSKGVTSGIINLGGNVVTIGKKRDGSDFKVGIQKPFAQAGTYITAIPASDKSIVTSGIYERYFKVDKTIYHHILDLETGYPVQNNLYSVTIISDKSIDGDALSTTCFCLGIEKGMKLIESMDNVEAIFVDSNMKLHSSSGI